MKNSNFSRRVFLKGLGLGGAFLPLVGPDKVWGAVGGPKRTIVIGWSNGYVLSAWRPSGSGTNFSFNEILKPLEPFKDKTIVIDGVSQKVHYEANAKALGWGKDQWYGGHDGYPGVLTGVPLSKYADNLEWSGGDSIDQFIATEAAKIQKLPFDSLTLAVSKEASGYYGSLSYKGKSPGVTGERDPANLFKRLFSTGGGGTLPGGQIDKAFLARKSVLDYLHKDLDGFGTRLGGDDKHSIATHLESIRDIEKQLTAGGAAIPAAAGKDCAMPTSPATMTLNDSNNMPSQIKALCDLVVLAFKCNQSRVATMTMSNAGGDDCFFPFLGADFVGKGDEYPQRQYHDITHNQGKSPEHTRRKIRVEQWYFEQVAYLAAAFKAVPEASGGTMLDNTLIAVTNSMGSNHDSRLVPFTFIGNIGGYFKTGQYLKVDKEAHNKVMVSIANAMGIDGSMWGAPQYSAELPGLKA
jgi:hypothetical protein